MSPSPPAGLRSQLDFRTTLIWRLVVISGVVLSDVGLNLLGHGHTTAAMLPWYLGYGILVASLWLAHRLLGARGVDWLYPLSLCLDLVAIAAIQHRGNGAFWHGAMFYALAVLVASAVLTPRGVIVVTLAAIFVFASKAYLEAYGLWTFTRMGPPTRAFYGTPGYAIDHVVLGVVALVSVAFIQRKLVMRIQRAEAEHRAIIEASPDLLLTFDRTGLVLSANAAAVAALGEAVTAGARFDLVRMAFQSHQAARRAFMSARYGSPATMHTALSLGAKGTRQLSITFAPVLDDGDVRAVLVSARDVTDEREAVAEREELQRQLEESRRMQLVGRLVSGVAHELNNPLSAILNHAELLRDGGAQSRADIDDGLDIIRGEARRSREIVRDLLQVARADSRRLRSQVSLERLAHDVVAALRPLAELHDVNLVCTTEGDMPSIVIDATGISQVLTNLVMNAIDACGADGNVGVHVDTDDGFARLVVEDDGPGIAPAVRAHLFEPFVTTKGPGNGTGLGLAVSLGIVEQHEGRLHVEDVWPTHVRRGARFVVMLPMDAAPSDAQTMIPLFPDVMATTPGDSERAETEPSNPPVAADQLPADVRAEKRVLIVEDEPAIRAGLQRWFTRGGWLVKTVADGVDALDALRAFELEGVVVDAIICDLRMPRMGGPEFYARLERVAPALTQRIIFSTGDIVSEEVRTFLTSVDVPVLEKPFEFRALEAQLATLRRAEVPATN